MYQLIKKRTAVFILTVSCLALQFAISCNDNGNIESVEPPDDATRLRSNKYAILCTAVTMNPSYQETQLDPIDINAEWISILRIYRHLKKSGFSDENIFILYSDQFQEPDWSEKELAETSEEIKKKHFNGNYSNNFTIENLKFAAETIASKANKESTLVLYISGHGNPIGISLPDFYSYICPHDLKIILKHIPSKKNLILISSCWGGVFLSEAPLEFSLLATSSVKDKQTWVDRNFNEIELFLRYKTDISNDQNSDGIVQYMEAHKAMQEEAERYYDWLKIYLENNSYETGEIELYPLYFREGSDYTDFNL